MSQVNIFEKASRLKLRFSSARGELSVEDLWDVPLSRGVVNLNDLAKVITRSLKTTEEEGLVKVQNKANSELELRLEILKHIFEVRSEEVEEKSKAAENAQTRQRLAELIARKQDQELEGKSVEELQAMLDASK